jgi:hypothetical protein
VALYPNLAYNPELDFDPIGVPDAEIDGGEVSWCASRMIADFQAQSAGAVSSIL